MRVIPYPDRWMSYGPMPEMEGKCLGIFANILVRDGEQRAVRDVFRDIVDVATEEKTCTVLSACQSLVSPNHNLLYEEWTDYDEFFQVQMGRPYRNAFLRWYDPLREGIVSPEFTEMFYSSGKHPFNVAYHAYTAVQSVHVASGREEDARRVLIQRVDDAGEDDKNLVANVHQSLNNAQHFLLYEVWSDFSHLVEVELRSDRRRELEAHLNEFKNSTLPEPALELFQIFYDSDKYVPPAE